VLQQRGRRGALRGIRFQAVGEKVDAREGEATGKHRKLASRAVDYARAAAPPLRVVALAAQQQLQSNHSDAPHVTFPGARPR
jgi:hypothetical protein